MSLLVDKSIRDFSSLLASSEPAPGGGSTAALSGVLGAALSMMVVNLSLGKKAYEALEDEIKDTIQKDFDAIKALYSELTSLVDEDTKAFNMFMEAMKLPKETEEQKKLRLEEMQKASIYALEVPLTVAGKCLEVLKHQAVIAQFGNKNAVSDIGVGAVMALAALEGAALNVKINLPGIKDAVIKSEAGAKIESFLDEGKILKAKILEIVEKRIADNK